MERPKQNGKKVCLSSVDTLRYIYHQPCVRIPLTIPRKASQTYTISSSEPGWREAAASRKKRKRKRKKRKSRGRRNPMTSREMMAMMMMMKRRGNEIGSPEGSGHDIMPGKDHEGHHYGLIWISLLGWNRRLTQTSIVTQN